MATAYLNPDPLPMIIDSIDLMEIMMQFFFLAQRLENIREELVTAATKSGGVSFLRAIGDGAEPPDAVFKETWTSLKYWVGIHSDVPWIESTDFPEPEYLTVKDFNRIAEWVSHSCKILNDFMAKFPNEKVRKVTLEEKRASNGEVSLDMLRVSSKTSASSFNGISLT
ncbi:hypothetical protein MMC24_003531 [Lignoscripta atroalba]|nr:hypothetical protein [Lignoscripta atroalba]